MNIVIIGAGAIGQYLAEILSKEEHNVTVVDTNKDKLAQLASTVDVATRVGSGSDWQLIDELLELSPDVLIAATNDDDTNLVACSLAKQLGFPSTIARVHDSRYLNRTRLDFGRVFDVDYFICPELLTANEIYKYVTSRGSLAVEIFAHGAVKMRVLQVPKEWESSKTPLSKLHLPNGVMVGLIRRVTKDNPEGQVIFPHGSDVLMPGDEVTFIGEREAIADIHKFLGLRPTVVRSVMLAGGSLTAFHLAKLLEKKQIGVRIIEKNYNRAIYLADVLTKTTIVNHDVLDVQFLRSEKIDQVDLFIACTKFDEVNSFACMLAKEGGCEDVLMILTNQANLPVLQRLGIAHAIAPVIAASNRILSHLFTGTVNTLVSLYNNRAEVLEINVSPDSKVVGIPLSDLGPILPKDFLIAVIQNRGRIMVAHGNRIISPGDTVIVITDPKHVPELEKIF